MRARLVRTSLPLGSRRAFTAPALAALVLTTAACGPDPDSGALKPRGAPASGQSAPAAPTQSGPPSIPTAEIDKMVLRGYSEYIRVYKLVYETNDPAPLATVATDPLLTDVTKDVERTKARGEFWRFAMVSKPRVYTRSQDGLTVYVVDCLRTLGSYRFSIKTGKRIGSGGGATLTHRTALRYEAGVWKVSETRRGRAC